MAPSFGARLKAQRESRHVTLETIAEQTKIRSALLDGLERGDVSQWPAGIFRRSYVRSYAMAIGLDPEATVHEFLAQYPDAAEEPPAAILANAEVDHRPKTRLHYLLSSAMGAVSKPFDKERSAAPGGPEHKQPGQVESAAGRFEFDSVTLPVSKVTAENVRAEIEPDVTRAEIEPDVSNHPAVAPELAAADSSGDEFEADVELGGADHTGAQAPSAQVDLAAMAQLCTHIVEAENASDVETLLGEAARILRAIGIMVWPWDPARGVMTPSLSHGYPRRMLAGLPTLAGDADNPIGAAFRSSARQIVTGGGSTTGAIVVPLTTPRGCSGVLAIEYGNGLEQDASIQALATILAAQLSRVVQAEPSARHAIA
jgi:cytoskeletal protein RodZ